MKIFLSMIFATCFIFFPVTSRADGCQIFVAKLNYASTNDDLRYLFEEFGTVSEAKIVMDGSTGRSRGFAFVSMPDCNQAYQAINNLNDIEFDGRRIVVKMARSANQQSGGRKPYARGGGYN